MQTLVRVCGWGVSVVAVSLLAGCPAPPAPDQGGGGTPGAGAATAPAAGTATTPAASSGATSLTRFGPDDGLLVGGYMSLTGAIATYGQGSAKAMGMAVDEINAKGGVLGGKQLRLVLEDSASKPEEARNVVQRLLDQHHAPIIVGEVASSLSLTAAPLCQKAGVPMLTPSSTNPTVTQQGDFIFRSCFTDDLQGAYAVAFARQKGLKKAAIIEDKSNDYSKGLREVIQREFAAKGGQVLATEAFNQGDRDFTAILTKLKPLEQQGMDVIFIPAYYEEVGLIIKQARENGLKSTLVGTDGWDSPRLAEIAGDHLNNGCYFVNHYSKSEDRPKVQAFVSAYKARWNDEPDALAACAYDAMYIVADAIDRAGAMDPAKLREALAQTKDFDGVTGRITLDAQRNATKPCVVLTFQQGAQVIETTLQPDSV